MRLCSVYEKQVQCASTWYVFAAFPFTARVGSINDEASIPQIQLQRKSIRTMVMVMVFRETVSVMIRVSATQITIVGK